MSEYGNIKELRGPAAIHSLLVAAAVAPLITACGGITASSHDPSRRDVNGRAVVEREPSGRQRTSVGPMHPPAPSMYVERLASLGLDARNLPPLASLNAETLRAVMDYLSEATGAGCLDCHIENDFGAMTRRKWIAERMWDQWARGLSFRDGQPVFCDSCHQKGLTILDRRDRKALGQWMDTNYVEQLRRKDSDDHNCQTCHGDPMNMTFLTAWSRPLSRCVA